MCAQWKAFWDATGGLWQSGGLVAKPFGLFTSTASQGGGQETTPLTCARIPRPPAHPVHAPRCLPHPAALYLCCAAWRPAPQGCMGRLSKQGLTSLSTRSMHPANAEQESCAVHAQRCPTLCTTPWCSSRLATPTARLCSPTGELPSACRAYQKRRIICSEAPYHLRLSHVHACVQRGPRRLSMGRRCSACIHP